MLPEPTYCHDCDNALHRGKADPPWRWLCIKHKRLDGFGFVTPTSWDGAPPYLYCKDVNGGACPLFVKATPGQMRLGEIETQS
jgi:hypothetical protein